MPLIRTHPTNGPFCSYAKSQSDDEDSADAEGANSRACPLLNYIIHDVHTHSLKQCSIYKKIIKLKSHTNGYILALVKERNSNKM